MARCGADELACKPDPVALQGHDQPHGTPRHHVNRFAKREAIAKWLQVRLPITETKQHIRPFIQPVTDQPSLWVAGHVSAGGVAVFGDHPEPLPIIRTLQELGVDLLVAVVGAFLGVGVVGSVVGFGGGGVDEPARVEPFGEHHVELRAEQGHDAL